MGVRTGVIGDRARGKWGWGRYISFGPIRGGRIGVFESRRRREWKRERWDRRAGREDEGDMSDISFCLIYDYPYR